MYIPRHFNWKKDEEILDFIRQYPFGMLVTGNGKILVTHLPFVCRSEEGNLLLRSHMSIDNLQWNIIGDCEVLVVFQYPNAYISPSWYGNEINVPTWNYLSVHCYGTVRLITEKQEAEKIMFEMFTAFDSNYTAQYHALPEQYKDKLYAGIMAFEIKVEDLQAKAKLSQNKPMEDKVSVIQALEHSGYAGDGELALWMKKIYQLP